MNIPLRPCARARRKIVSFDISGRVWTAARQKEMVVGMKISDIQPLIAPPYTRLLQRFSVRA